MSDTPHAPLLPGRSPTTHRAVTLGVLGGGQLGRMFVHAAQTLGYRTVVLDPDPNSPAGLVSHLHLKADYLDATALGRMIEECSAITTEFENVPALALATLAMHRPVAPGAHAVSICQDRAKEKALFTQAGVGCAPHAVIDSAESLRVADPALLPGILKTAQMGYDGKGQVRVSTAQELAAAWDALKCVPCVLEKMLDIEFEISVIVARNHRGQTVHFPVRQNLHRQGILALSFAPAPRVDAALAERARSAATALAQALAYVGVLCVEFFVLKDGRLVANEMAPRPHNSGHDTIDACDLSQFDLQVRAMADLPLVAPRQHSPSVLINLLGDMMFDHTGTPLTPAWDQVLALPGAHLHLYGKAEARPGRKMGHLTFTAPSPEQAQDQARKACAILGLETF